MNTYHLDQNGTGQKVSIDLDNGQTLDVAIMPDDGLGDSPREWDNLGTMVCFHPRYTLGDEQPTDSPDEFLTELACSLDATLEDTLWYWEDGPGWSRCLNEADFVNRQLDKNTAKKISVDPVDLSNYHQRNAVERVLDAEIAVMLPLYLYDHSGITMRCVPFHCPWDSGQVGFIYITKEKIREEYSAKRISKKLLDRVTGYLVNEVKTYDQYLTGDVYGYSVDLDGEHIDSCWGFYGADYVLEEVNAIVKQYDVEVAF